MIRSLQRSLLVWAATALPLLAAGCSTSSDVELARAAVRDSLGVTIVEYPQVPAGLAPWVVSAEPVTTIGALDGTGPDVFGRLESVALLSDGTVVVADGLNRELRAFDRQGAHQWTAGGGGDGPGEFSSLSGAYVIQGDSILAAGGGRVVSIFSPDGAYVRQFRMEAPPDGYPGGPMVMGATRRGSPVAGGLAMPDPEPGYYTTSLMVAFYDGDGLRAAAYGPLLHGEGVFLTVDAAGTYASSAVPMGRRAQVAVGSDAVAVTTQERFEIRVLDAEGRLQRIIRVSADPAPVDDNVRRRYVEDTGLARSQNVFAPTLPALGRILYDADGQLWVEKYAPPYEGSSTRWWVFGRDGRFAAEVSIPQGLALKAVGGDLAAGIAVDEFDTPSVRLHSLVR